MGVPAAGAEGGGDAVGQDGKDGDVEGFGRFEGDSLGQDAVGAEAEVGVLLRAPERNHAAIVPLEVRFDLKTRLLGSSLFVLTVLLRAGTLLFGAALLFSAVVPTEFIPGLTGVEEAHGVDFSAGIPVAYSVLGALLDAVIDLANLALAAQPVLGLPLRQAPTRRRRPRVLGHERLRRNAQPPRQLGWLRAADDHFGRAVPGSQAAQRGSEPQAQVRLLGQIEDVYLVVACRGGGAGLGQTGQVGGELAHVLTQRRSGGRGCCSS